MLVALLLAEEGHINRAVQLYAMAWKIPYVANSHWLYDVAGRKLESVAASLPPEQVAAVAAEAQADPSLELAGLWSHLHSPEDPPTSDGQLLRFDIATTALRDARVPVPPRHAAASGGIFTGDEPALVVRLDVEQVPRRPRDLVDVADAIATVVHDHRAVLGDVPAFGDTGFRLQGVGVFDCQALEQGANDVVFGHPGHDMRIKSLGFGAIAVMEDAIAIAAQHIRFAAACSFEPDVDKSVGC